MNVRDQIIDDESQETFKLTQSMDVFLQDLNPSVFSRKINCNKDTNKHIKAHFKIDNNCVDIDSSSDWEDDDNDSQLLLGEDKDKMSSSSTRESEKSGPEPQLDDNTCKANVPGLLQNKQIKM